MYIIVLYTYTSLNDARVRRVPDSIFVVITVHSFSVVPRVMPRVDSQFFTSPVATVVSTSAITRKNV